MTFGRHEDGHHPCRQGLSMLLYLCIFGSSKLVVYRRAGLIFALVNVDEFPSPGFGASG